MSFDSYIQIKGAPGEGTDDKHKDWIEILAYSHRIHQPASETASSAGGAGAGRVEHGTFNFTHLMDLASVKLFEFCCKGTVIDEVTVELCRAGGDKFKYMEIKLTEGVMVSTISTDASARGESNFPTETVSLSYGKIQETYFQQKRKDGSGGGQVTATWDLTKNSPK